MTGEEVLKDVQKFLNEKDNENIIDEDVKLDELYDVKSIILYYFIST